jgi:hypothetical protein
MLEQVRYKSKYVNMNIIRWHAARGREDICTLDLPVLFTKVKQRWARYVLGGVTERVRRDLLEGVLASCGLGPSRTLKTACQRLQ